MPTYVVVTLYPTGWEISTYADGRVEAEALLRDYQENERHLNHRVRRDTEE